MSSAAKDLPEHSPPERFGPFPPMRESDDITPVGSARDRLLSEDRSEIELVSAAQRDVWFKRADDLPFDKKRKAALDAARRWRERRAK